MKFCVHFDMGIDGEFDNIEEADGLAKSLAVKNSPKMASVRDSGQKRGDPARRTYAVEEGVLKWSSFSGLKIEIGEVRL